MGLFEIIFAILLYPIFGWYAAEELIGDRTFYYLHTDSDFGLMNTFKGKTETSYSLDLEKENVRRYFYVIIGGCFSFVLAVFLVIYTWIKTKIDLLKWAFSK